MTYLKNVATIKVDKEKCTGCEMCMDVCPRGVLAMCEGKADIIGRNECIECGACQKNCAFGAITVTSGVGCAQALFNALITGGEPVCDCEKGSKTKSACC
jgi:ferredoxin